MNGKCPLCRGVVEMTDAVWDPRRMRYWHERCIRSKLMTRLTVLQKKLTRGTITADEAREADEINLELQGFAEIEKRLESKDVKLLQQALTSTAPFFSKKDPRYIDVDAVSIRLRTSKALAKKEQE